MSNKTIIYIDLDNVVFDYDTARNDALAKTPDIRWPQSQCGFFLNLKPIEGAIDGVKTLFEDERFDCWFLSAPSVMNPLSYTEKRLSVERHFGLEYAKKLILSPDKSLLKGRFLIDDNIKGKGQDKFQGDLIHFGSESIKNWTDVISFINSYLQKVADGWKYINELYPYPLPTIEHTNKKGFSNV